MRTKRFFQLVGLATVWASMVVVPASVHAGGFEYAPAGTRSLGRGGAFHARADDPMALLYNPANLAWLPDAQLTVNSHFALMNECFQRSGHYFDSTVTILSAFDSPGTMAGDDYLLSTFPEICNEGMPAISPQVAFAVPLAPGLGLAFGLFPPTAPMEKRWSDDGVVVGPGGQRLPSPGRYALVDQDLLVVFPTVGIGWSPSPRISVGVALQWGMARLSFMDYTVASPVQEPASDIRTATTMTDLFVPAAIVSAHWVPIDSLDFTVGFRWSDAIQASGNMELGWGRFGVGREATATLPAIDSTLPSTTRVDIDFEAPQPWWLFFGARFSDRVAPRGEPGTDDAGHDPMSSERWDLELDVIYEVNSLVDDYELRVLGSPTLDMPEVRGGALTGSPLGIPARTLLPHRWKDQLVVRVGGDWNVVQGLLALRMGVSFETSGIDPAYAQLDFMPGQRFGIHAGATVRFGEFDLSLAYAHIFQATLEVGVGEAQLRQVSASAPGEIINAGRYTASYDILSLAATWHL